MVRKRTPTRWWLLGRMWWANRGGNAVVVALILVSFPLYGVYSAWSQAVTAPVEERVVQVEPPAEVLWTVPHWLASWGGDQYDLEIVLEREDLEGNLRDYHPVVHGTVMSPWGTVDAWGVSGDRIQRDLDIEIKGEVPRPGTMVIDVDLLGDSIPPGDLVTIKFVDTGTREVRSLVLQVSGVFTCESPLVSGLILDRSDLEHLLGLTSTNAAFLWAEPREPRVVGSVYQPSRIERQPMFLIRDLEAVRPFDVTRRPPVEIDRGPEHGVYPVDLPFAMAVGDRMFWDPDFPAQQLKGLYTIVEGVAGLVGLAFFLLGLGLTVVILVTVMDQEQDLGIYKALGFTPGEISGLHAMQMGVNLVLGTLLGAPCLAYLLPLASDILGLPLSVPGVAYVVWGFSMALLILWSGRVVAVMFSRPSVMSLLKQESRFDWWGLIRLE